MKKYASKLYDGVRLKEKPENFDKGSLCYLMNKIEDYPNLSLTKIKELIMEAHKFPNKYKENKDRVIMSHIKLVINIAKRYSSVLKGLEFSDIVVEGIIGLIKAFDKYNMKKYENVSFGVYATWWIRAYIYKAIVKDNNITTVPYEVTRRQIKIDKSKANLYQKSGEIASVKEISDNTNIPVDKVAANVSSGQRSIYYDGEKNLSTPKKNNIHIGSLLKCLDKRETFIIKSFFGITVPGDSAPPMKLEEIGQAMNPPISIERVRQIKKRALNKLKDQSKNSLMSCINKMCS